MDDVRAAVRQQILTAYLIGESPENLRDDMPLLTSGILDSLATMGLVTFLEKRYGIELDAADITVERFDTVTDIARIVERKRAAANGPANAR